MYDTLMKCIIWLKRQGDGMHNKYRIFPETVWIIRVENIGRTESIVFLKKPGFPREE